MIDKNDILFIFGLDIILGVIEKICLSVPVLAPYTTAVEFGLLIVILLVRPIGILGKKRREKV